VAGVLLAVAISLSGVARQSWSRALAAKAAIAVEAVLDENHSGDGVAGGRAPRAAGATGESV